MNHLRCIFVGFVLSGLTSQVLAVEQTVNFSTAVNGGHLKANNQPLGSDTFIELGAFTPGFAPTSLNRASWKQNWNPLARRAYNAQTQYFSGSANITTNTTPYTTTNKAWVWVFDRSGNWALYSDNSWTWPDTSGTALPLDCNPGSANIVVAGQVNATNPRIVCELVTDAPSPGVTYTQWADLVLPEGSRGQTTDYDGDGQNNFIEYAFGTDASNRNSFFTDVRNRDYSGQSYLSAKVLKGWATGLTYTVQWSDNLSNWYTTGLTTVSDTATLLEVRDTNPIGTETKRFMRVMVSSP